jgi:hypothetical protein
MSYEDLTLRTPDGINIRAYLLLQRKDLTRTGEGDVTEQMEVSANTINIPNERILTLIYEESLRLPGRL